MGMQGTPCWYELSTTDLNAAAGFYGAILGWQVTESQMPEMDYRLAAASDGGLVAGLTSTQGQEEASPPNWVIYFAVDSADDTVGQVSGVGGSVLVPPTDVPGTGRFAILADPQGAVFGVLQPEPMEGSEPSNKAFDMDAPGHGAWNELMTRDPEAAFDFYAGQFGWTKGDAFEMGESGTYQTIAHDGESIGGLMGLGDSPMPSWLPYFAVGNGVAASIEAITTAGGSIHAGPTEVPGGAHMAVCQDPQGAWFAILGGE